MYSFEFKNGDVLELKGIKHAAFASQETHCYEASVYFNGKIIGWVNNDGYGGSDTFNAKPIKHGADHVCAKGSFADNNKLWNTLETRIAEEHPQYFMEWDKSWNKMTLEIWCCNQVNKFLSTKDFNRYMKSKVVFIQPDEPKAIRYFSFKGVRSITQQHIDHIKSKYPTYQILNDMPKAEALDLWVSCNA
tara:strand:+ start:397 stop:966 length:570 start_codon:yes stop_codon:yes gene_type:complete